MKTSRLYRGHGKVFAFASFAVPFIFFLIRTEWPLAQKVNIYRRVLEKDQIDSKIIMASDKKSLCQV